MTNGSAQRASQALAQDPEAGFKVAAQTLTRWCAKDPQRDEQIRAEQRPKLFLQINAEHHLRVAQEATTTVSKLVRRVDST